MFFRNLTLFRYPASMRKPLQQLDEHLAGHTARPLGPLELSTRGFVSPFGRGETQLTHGVGDCVLLTLGGEDKLLPAAVVNEALAARLDVIREREGRNPGGRERKRLKDEVLTDLLPRAFARPSRLNAYLDLGGSWLLIDSASRKNAEALVAALREALGSFPALPVAAASSPRSLLTAWLGGEPLPRGFALGDECELRDPADTGAVVRCRGVPLDGEEVREHLKTGKQAWQLGLVFAERIAFVLGEDLVVRKLKFLDIVTEELERGERDSLRAELDATFALMSGELKPLLAALGETFGLAAAGD